MTRAAVVALAAGLVIAPLVFNAASAAVSGPTISSPADGSTVSGNAVHIKATASTSNTLQSWKVELSANPAATSPTWTIPSGAACSNGAASGSSVAIDCVWDTTKVVNGTAISSNGAFAIRVTASDRGSLTANPDTKSVVSNVTVSNRAAAPANVHVTFNEGQQVATVSWSGNAEPDITGYTIKESQNGGAFKLVGSAGTCSTCSWSRIPPAPGTYNYQVLANRSGASASAASTAPESVTVTAPPTTTTSTTTTTTTTAPSGSSTGGSTSGGSTSGGSTSGGSTGGGASSSSSNDLYSGVVVNGFHLVAIPGGPQSAQGQSVTIGGKSVFNEPQEGDPGFSETLPYAKANKPADSTVVAIAKLPGRIITDESARKAALTVPAIGLLLFVFAMQIRFLTRRAAN